MVSGRAPAQTAGPAAQELAGEIDSHEEGEKPQPPPYTYKETKTDGQGHGSMNRQEPLPGEPGDPCSPEAEREIQEEDETSHFPDGSG